MRKSLVAFLIWSLLLGSRLSLSLEKTEDASPVDTQIRAAEKLLYNNVIITLRNGGLVAGALAGIDNEGVIILKKGQEEKIPRGAIQQITIDIEKNRTWPVFLGFFGGAYLGSLIFLRAKGQPPVYMKDYDSTLGLLLWEGIFVAAGTGLGYWFGSALEKGEKVFEFTGGEQHNLRIWEALKKFILQIDQVNKVHFSVQGGQVLGRASSRFQDLLKEAGYHIWSAGYNGTAEAEAASNFNLLRKVQLTYSLRPGLEIGTAVSFLGEPSLSGWRQTESQTAYDPSLGSYTTYQTANIMQAFSSTGYFVCCLYKPFFSRLPKNLSWDVGLGAGAAQIKVDLRTTISTSFPYYPYYTEISSESKISKTRLSSLVFTELKFYLSDGFSVGLIADYVFAPALKTSAIPEAGIPAQKLRLVNGSAGFTLGFDF